jgi:hypothetical protein
MFSAPSETDQILFPGDDFPRLAADGFAGLVCVIIVVIDETIATPNEMSLKVGV